VWGGHHISAAEGFNAIAYGFGYAESYGYAAGTNLKNLNEFINLQNPATLATQPNGCTGVEYKLQVTLPFITADIKWDFKDGSPIQDDPNPIIKSTVVKDGTPLYVYEYRGGKIFSSGDHTVVASVLNPVANDCGSIDEVEFDFNIADPPVAKFSFTGTCIGEATLFKDITITNGLDIKTWLWDFGDGKTAMVQNPSHTYALPGNYAVRLTVTNQNGCSSTFDQLPPVHIDAKPVADFSYSAIDCPGTDIVFTDNSTSTDAAVAKWLWDFGDGSAIVEKTDNTPFTHKFTKAGSYVVKLTVLNTNGCTSVARSKILVIHELPKVDFTLPDACISDMAQFEDKSTVADNTEADFTYAWNFGDEANATSSNPNTSTQKNPTHRYIEARNNYRVTLKITSKYGCVSTKTQIFSVYGGDVKANVTLLNSNNLCSNQEVVFVNNSTVNIGIVTKLEVTYDAGDPTTKVVYNYPASGQLLKHTYPSFTDGTRSYNVKVTAYSGSVCFDSEMLNTFTLAAVPTITFKQTPPLCPESAPVQLIPSFQGAVSGTGVYSGAGVSASGLFNPAKAGTGTFDIIYNYTTQKGCSVTVPQQITVYPSPTVSAGDDFTVLEETSATIKATANNALAYKWYPSAGLDHDDVLNPVASPTESTTYKLIVTSATNCTAMDEVNVNVLKKLVVPNTFTPNGDGYNDVWEIKYLSAYPNNTVDVYNRYGEKLYSSVGYSIPWDGKYKGADVPPGTYYYIINPKNGRKVISGSVTIIR
jgi:gliding motility-associated-like protein